MTNLKWLASFILTTHLVPALSAKTRCPRDIEDIVPRIVQGALIVIPVKINSAGPYDFIVDTGSQITVIDPALASELHLKLQGSAGLISIAGHAQASIASLNTLQAGSHLVEKPFAVVQDLGPFQAADSRIRGVLGENFLSHFDVLIDNENGRFCLDETASMRAKVRGEHIPLMALPDPDGELPFMARLVISAHLSSTGTRDILLQLDSGSDGPVLFARPGKDRIQLLERAMLRKGNFSEAQKAFADLPPQELRIGKYAMTNFRFVTPVSLATSIPEWGEDGLLPTLMFHRIFISAAEHFVVLDPR
jgi:hypothetical protein